MAFGTLYLGGLLARPVVERRVPPAPLVWLISGNALLWAVGLVGILYVPDRTGLGWILALAGALHLGAAQLVAARVPSGLRASETLRAIGAAFLLGAVPCALRSNAIAPAWAGVGVALLFAARRVASSQFRIGAAAGLFLALARVFLVHLHLEAEPERVRAFWNPDFAISIGVLLAFSVAAALDRKSSPLLAVIGGLAFLAVLAREVEVALLAGGGDRGLIEA
jgi:hypothetical protein